MTTAEQTHFICEGAMHYSRFVMYATGNDPMRVKFRNAAKQQWDNWQELASPLQIRVAKAITMTAREFCV